MNKLAKTVMIRISSKAKALIIARANLSGKTQSQILDEYLGVSFLRVNNRKRKLFNRGESD